ncbi:hypothetical protein [Streptomyces sp. NPDC005438]|uniref:hypothetical protein n=1 Tax=Streptomyces sp. NPDC005438 TaxID=3156880 RepID=UPI0033BE2F7E
MLIGRTLSPGARIAAVLVLLALALTNLGWIIRDLNEAGRIVDVLWLWTGQPARADNGLWASSALDPQLLMVYVVSAAVVPRSGSTRGVVGTLGLLTVLLRLPRLWDSRVNVWPLEPGLATRVDVTTYGTLLLGLVLLVLALTARRDTASAAGRPDAEASGGTGTGPGGPPARPRRWRARVAGVLALALAGVATAWEVHWSVELSGDSYWDQVWGDRYLFFPLLGSPPGWIRWATLLLLLAVAGTALARAAVARPLGMTVAGLVAMGHLLTLVGLVRADYLQHLGSADTETHLTFWTSLTGLPCALLVLVLLLAREAQPPPPSPAGERWAGREDLAPLGER